MSNLTVRIAAREKGVKFWQIANRLGVSESTLTRKFRCELNQDETAKFLRIIDELASEAGKCADAG